MRVIAGKARRLALKTVPGMETRPTTDRIKETLFNILQPEIPDCRFLAALLTAAVYAATDEFHQYFIPGRSAAVIDVCIDTLGALIGLAILFFTLKVVRKHCQKSKLTLQ